MSFDLLKLSIWIQIQPPSNLFCSDVSKNVNISVSCNTSQLYALCFVRTGRCFVFLLLVRCIKNFIYWMLCSVKSIFFPFKLVDKNIHRNSSRDPRINIVFVFYFFYYRSKHFIISFHLQINWEACHTIESECRNHLLISNYQTNTRTIANWIAFDTRETTTATKKIYTHTKKNITKTNRYKHTHAHAHSYTRIGKINK